MIIIYFFFLFFYYLTDYYQIAKSTYNTLYIHFPLTTMFLIWFPIVVVADNSYVVGIEKTRLIDHMMTTPLSN
jgi:hypothetical protein